MKNIVLIGMPSAGKSTIGVILAKYMCMDFNDTDVLIQTQQGELLQDIINDHGIGKFLKIEENAVVSLKCTNTIIATGGSVVYSEKAMKHLKDIGIVVYLHIDLDTVVTRLNNIKTRGVVFGNGQSLSDIYLQRKPLYEKYADVTIKCGDSTIDETIDVILNRMEEYRN